jgi:signal transduction histidine kinase
VLLAAIPKVEQRRLLRFFTLLPGGLGLVVSTIGFVEFVLQVMGVGEPADFGFQRWLMFPLSAVSFIFAGAALTIAQPKASAVSRWGSRILALLVGAVSLFVLLKSAIGFHITVDTIWSPAYEVPAAFRDSRMAISTALAFVLFAQGLFFLDGDRRENGLRSQFFATLVIIIGFLTLVGHIFRVSDFYRFPLLSGMSLSSALTVTLLGTGLLFSQLKRGVPALVTDNGAAGFVARRLLPGAVLVPFTLTILRSAGEERGIFSAQQGASLFAVADMVVFLLLIAWSARVLRDIDRKRGELYILEREAHEASEKARAEAESANGAKSDFLAVMSHELRTPLAAIMGYQELLADGITGPITDAQAQQLGRIKASARHLLSLIDEILTFTRLDAGRETVIPETFLLDDALREACEIVEPLATAKKLEMRIVSPGPGAKVESDPTKIRQILVNLLSNAVKFTDKGTVSAEATIRGNDFVLKVSDTGIGIQQEHLHKIFDPFWQVEQKATRRATGTGLGLTVTKRLANLLGGDVDVMSAPGEGTTFTVTLPTKAPHIVSIPERTQLLAG